MNETGMGPLQDGGTAVVIGGGPGGTAAALALKQGAQALGRQIQVVIIEEKHFAGEQHYNQCAGVLSPPIATMMEQELSVPFPHHLTQCMINGYVLHTAKRQITLDGEAEPSIALRRIQFDAYMLDVTRQRGVEVQAARATDIEFHADKVIVYTNSGSLKADVVVGAFGLDEGAAAIFRRAVSYRQPAALSSVVTKYHPGDAGIKEFGQRIHAFLPPDPEIEFGAVTPKGNHLTINIAGAAVDARLMEAFLATPDVRKTLPYLENAGRFSTKDLRYFKGRFPRGLAHNFAGDRFVMVGDAAGLVRAFKGKGVTSAIQTGIRAAQVILNDGISEWAFQKYRALNADIIGDLPYGQVMRHLTILGARLGLMDVVLLAAEQDEHLRRALFDAVSAHRPYREVVRDALSPAAMHKMVTGLGRAMLG